MVVSFDPDEVVIAHFTSYVPFISVRNLTQFKEGILVIAAAEPEGLDNIVQVLLCIEVVSPKLNTDK
jgi:hypothetical protein